MLTGGCTLKRVASCSRPAVFESSAGSTRGDCSPPRSPASAASCCEAADTAWHHPTGVISPDLAPSRAAAVARAGQARRSHACRKSGCSSTSAMPLVSPTFGSGWARYGLVAVGGVMLVLAVTPLIASPKSPLRRRRQPHPIGRMRAKALSAWLPSERHQLPCGRTAIPTSRRFRGGSA
jgi:hypothetical protein